MKVEVTLTVEIEVKDGVSLEGAYPSAIVELYDETGNTILGEVRDVENFKVERVGGSD